MPAVALLCGRFVDRVLRGEDDPRLLAQATRWTAALGTGAALCAALLATHLEGAAAPLRALAALLLVTSVLPMLAELRGHRRLVVALFALPVALGAPWLAVRVLPAMEPWLDARVVAESMLAVSPPDAALVLLEPAPPSLRLELPRNLVTTTDATAAMGAHVDGRGDAYLSFPPGREPEALRAAPVPLEIVCRTPVLVLARVHLGGPHPAASSGD